MKCPKCDNSMHKVPIKEHVWMGMNKGYRLTKVGEKWVCDYCTWKGWSGPGARLKEIIKKDREEVNKTNE